MFAGGIELGRILGIRIRLDWSLIFIFLLVAFDLGAGVFPHWHPDWGPVLCWSAALAAAVLFFVSILLHELSHSLVAKAFGIPVSSITLFLFGGISSIEHDPNSPSEEALMAGVGPLMSIALGIVFTALAWLVSALPAGVAANPELAMHQMSPLSTLLAWLGPINILVGLFNLIPAFPLDGGRVFRATLWAITRSLRTATRWASRAGQAFAWLLIVTGVAMAFGFTAPLLGGGLVGGLWLAFIGWFLNTAAVTSYRQVVIRGLLQDVPVTRLMRPLPATIDPGSRIQVLVDDYLLSSDEREFVVATPERIVGLVRSSDVRKVPRGAWQAEPVSAIMTAYDALPKAISSWDSFQALQELGRTNVDEMLVANGKRVLGVIRRRDIARWLELEAHDEDTRARPTHWAGSHS
jgi:Zn-dependent protease